MKFQDIQGQYERIYSYFKTTCEPFDFLEWDGNTLQVWENEIVIERYKPKDLRALVLN